MVITNRDRKLLLKLHSCGMLTTNQLNMVVFNNIAVTTVLRRLRLLEKENLIKRIEGLSTTEMLWVLTEKGAALVGVKLVKRRFSKSLLVHDYKLVSLRLALEGNGIAHSWTPEHEIRSMVYKKYGLRDAQERLIPDGLMGVRVNDKMVSVAIELELTLKNRMKLKEIVRRYRLKNETFAVWYIVSSKMIIDPVYRLWVDRGGYTPIKIFFSYYDDVMKNPLRATLYNGESPKIIEEYFGIVPAQETAQRVSTLEEKISPMKVELTKENHAPILKEAC